MQSRHRSGRPPRLTRRDAIRESAYVPRPAGLTPLLPPPDQTDAAGSIRADDSGSEEGDEPGAAEEEEETGEGAATLSEASASSVVAVVTRRITNWTKLELVGAGSFGRVYKSCLFLPGWDGFIFAVKEASLIGPESNAKQSASQLEQEETVLSIFLEFVSEGSLVSVYEKKQLEGSTVSAYTRQILTGLAYLHHHNVMHRDIKCANILLDLNGTVKVGDFGLAKQVVRGTPYGRSADIWSLGCTVLEMFIQRPPYPDDNWVSASYQIGRGQLPPVPSSLSLVAHEFIHECLRVNPDGRPSADELLGHPFVALPD